MKQLFELNPKTKNLTCGGVDVIAFSDDYAVGHQAGISLIMHDKRMVNGGDIRLEQTPGQWQPVSVRGERIYDEKQNCVTTKMHYPDERQHLKGFNPLIYPDVTLDYKVQVKAHENGAKISVLLEQPIPKMLEGKACFSIEMVPPHVIGKSWIMDSQTGIFPTQPNGPTLSLSANIDVGGIYPQKDGKADLKRMLGDRAPVSPIVGGAKYNDNQKIAPYNPCVADDLIGLPYAEGHQFTALPESDLYCFSVTCEDKLLRLYDGRMNHNNGWFVLATELPVEQTGEVLTWYLEPRVKEDWIYEPVIQVSQVGYHPSQKKVAILECDVKDNIKKDVVLYQITAVGKKIIQTMQPIVWGNLLRYQYASFDFSDVKEEGLYQISYGDSLSTIFRVDSKIYERGVWQPVLEYFLPVQMCHMMVREKYRIWHGHCHSDDAMMAPVNFNHFDGYYQGPDTLCKYKPGEHVPGLNVGGWHDAGDYDLRIESQAGEVYNLALAYEEFGAYCDSTTIDQENHIVEIHQPDGKNDILEQIEHGLLSIVGGYEALGRLYRGIICSDLRQYVLLGDGANMTDGKVSEDDRMVFTEDNPEREFHVAAQLSAAYRSMLEYDKDLAKRCLKIAKELFEITKEENHQAAKVHAAVELFLSTGEVTYKDYLIENVDTICDNFERIGWIVARVFKQIEDETFKKRVLEVAKILNEKIQAECSANPYGIPYHPRAWGAGWDIQAFGMRYFFLYKAFSDIFSKEPILNALNFVLGCHPGKNTASYASGVGTKSATTAYCANRADQTFIPGGVISGTELISPNFPELLEYSLIWQQGEYVLGGGSSNYMFLVLAVDSLMKGV